jgi:hypothetical protein
MRLACTCTPQVAAWGYWSTAAAHVQLAAGTNTVVLGVASGDTGGGALPNIDWLQVSLSTDVAGLGTVCSARKSSKYIPKNEAALANPDAEPMSKDEVCGEENVLRHDGIAVGLSYAGHGSGVYTGGDKNHQNNIGYTSCVITDFGSPITATAISYSATSSDESVCGDTCVPNDAETAGCGSLAEIQFFVLSEDTSRKHLDLNTFTPVGQVSLLLDTTANNGEHARWLTQTQLLAVAQPVRHVAACRGSSGGGRDNILIDFLGLVPEIGEQCP